MSSFFKSAAMSLLSRTLQTLLYKYLSDVDVEGVALPSFSGSSESGWGVRLCNVKLRDGAKLLDLPGNVKSKNQSPPVKVKKSRGRRRQRHHGNDQSSHYSGRRNPDDVLDEVYSPEPATRYQSLADDRTMIGTDKEHNTDDTLVSSFDGDSEKRNSKYQSAPLPEKTQPKRSTSWLGSWFNQERVDSKENGYKNNAHHSSAMESGDHNSFNNLSNEDHAHVENDGGFVSSAHTSDDLSAVPLSHVSLETSRSHHGGEKNLSPLLEGNETNQYSNDFDWGESDDEDEDSLPEESTDEPKMILRLGQGCTIGTIDIRLVGKAIQVMLEDAFLTLEIIRESPTPSESSATKGKESPDKQTKIEPPKPELKTPGDKVLAENAVARLFSLIPNLFLRDIHIRIVIRDDSVHTPSIPHTSSSSSIAELGVYEEADFEYGINDSVIEFSIELLSVTDGDDFLAKFRSGLDDSDDDEDERFDDKSVQSDDNGNSVRSTSSSYVDNSNEFLTKRIRTGRGPEGGITLRLFPAGGEHIYIPQNSSSKEHGKMWARQSWISESEFVVLRCSGLDLQTRIYMGTKREINIAKNGWNADEYYEYDDFSLDPMLFGGVDYIAPGPRPPLPKMRRPTPSFMNKSGIDESKSFNESFESKASFIDENGIQCCSMKSSFHKVARGLRPVGCSDSLLPCDYDSIKWQKVGGGADIGHRLDASTPMPGLAFQLTVRDPLEINIDRQNLETIGNLISLFTKKQTENSPSSELNKSQQRLNDHNDNVNILDNGNHSSDHLNYNTHHDNSGDKSNAFERNKSEGSRTSRRIRRLGNNNLNNDKDDASSGFPSYMQSEKIQLLGIHLAECRIRLHFMKRNGEMEDGVSFCYWSHLGKCITLDFQQLTAVERPFIDMRFDIGHFHVVEYKGVEMREVMSLGVEHPVHDSVEVIVEAYRKRDKNRRSPWPSTAAAILEIAPPLDTLVYENRDCHAIQLRYTAVTDPGDMKDTARKYAMAQVGPGSVSAPYGIWQGIISIIQEARMSLLGPPKLIDPMEVDSILRYQVKLMGGRVLLDPLIEASVPLTVVKGELSTGLGFSVESFLESVHFRYGRFSANQVMEKGLSLQQIAELPESVRLRILIFLKDLQPLEEALGMKSESNPFLRYRAVNKAILKMAKQLRNDEVNDQHDSRKDWQRQQMTTITSASGSLDNRRQYLLNELLKLDDNKLEALVRTHRTTESDSSFLC